MSCIYFFIDSFFSKFNDRIGLFCFIYLSSFFWAEEHGPMPHCIPECNLGNMCLTKDWWLFSVSLIWYNLFILVSLIQFTNKKKCKWFSYFLSYLRMIFRLMFLPTVEYIYLADYCSNLYQNNCDKWHVFFLFFRQKEKRLGWKTAINMEPKQAAICLKRHYKILLAWDVSELLANINLHTS